MLQRIYWIAILVGLLAWAQASMAQELDNRQKQAVQRQKKNLADAEKASADIQSRFSADMKALDGKIIPPAFFEKYLQDIAAAEQKADNVTADLSKSQCPPEHADVKPMLDAVAAVKAAMADVKSSIEPKLAEAKKIADPANYPNLEADFAQIEELGKSYGSLNNFSQNPVLAAQLAEQFPRMVAWCQERFKVYQPLIIVTGGKESPLYKRYEKTALAIKKFQERAADFVKSSEGDLPKLLAEAEKMAKAAVDQKKPAYFDGGVQQKLDEAQRLLAACAALLPMDDARWLAMQRSMDESKARLDASRAALKAEIIAATTAPADVYEGADKEALRKAVLDAWKVAWPGDEVLGVRMSMKAFDRTTKWVWQDAESAWYKVDHSVLAATVAVRKGDHVLLFPAFVNVDHLSSETNYGVQTKGSGYVQREMLYSNWK